MGCGKIAVPEHRVKAMAEYCQLITEKDLRAFLGSIGYYRRYVFAPNFAEYSAKLTSHLAESTKHHLVDAGDAGSLFKFT